MNPGAPRETPRWERLINRLRPGVHQRSHATAPERYPELFCAARATAEELVPRRPRILSFGCSTGEECHSLRRHFSDAWIVGTDVAPRVLARARRRCADDPAIELVPGQPRRIAARAPFDLVFALSVLCRHRETRQRGDSSRVYPFARFDAAVVQLARWLAPGGLLVLYNTGYRFSDSSVAGAFDDLTPSTLASSGHVAQFDPDGLRASERERSCIFRKRVSRF